MRPGRELRNICVCRCCKASGSGLMVPDPPCTNSRARVADSRGMALVLTLLVVTLITAMIVEFAYAVYTGTNALHNWQTAQKLSLAARSGTKLASRLISEGLSGPPMAYPGFRQFSHEIPLKDIAGTITLRIEDENAKFNINKLGAPFGGTVKDRDPYSSFVRLLESLGLQKEIADRISDWVDANSEPRLRDSEKDARNSPLASIEELLLIPGIERDAYDKLLPYVTIYGDLINRNSAGVPVLLSLSADISSDMADAIILYRESTPFDDTHDFDKVPVIGSVGLGLSGITVTKGRYFRIVTTAESSGIKRVIECIVDAGAGNVVKYWKER